MCQDILHFRGRVVAHLRHGRAWAAGPTGCLPGSGTCVWLFEAFSRRRRTHDTAAPIGFLAGVACGGRPGCQRLRHGVAPPKVHLLRRLAAKVEVTLDQPIGSFSASHVPLQVLIHDVIERVAERPTIRICRGLVNRPVDLTVTHPEPVRHLLERLAAQLGSRLVVAPGRSDSRPLPTIRCPGDEVGDYIAIGGASP